jgi:hypothetical protein
MHGEPEDDRGTGASAVFFFPWLTPSIPACPFSAEFVTFLRIKFVSLSGRLKVCHHLQNLNLIGQLVRMFGVQSHTL